MVFSYYVAGNTAAGQMNVLSSNVEQCEQVIVLNHLSPFVKTKCMQEWLHANVRDRSEIELLESVAGKPFLDGIIHVREKYAIVSDAVIDDSTNITHTIDLSSYILDTEERQQAAKGYEENKHQLLGKAWNYFATGLEIHDELEHIYIQHMDFEKADEVANRWKQKYLPKDGKPSGKGHIRKRLFGTNTSEGSLNVVPHIIKNFSTVHHIKGRAGTGKSHFMNAIKDTCIQLGYDIDQYICSFDPESTDMIIVPELQLCLFDSTNPHEFIPKENDVVVDLYEETVEPGIDERYKELIEETTLRYTSFMKEGKQYLQKARQEQNHIDDLYKDVYTNSVMESMMHTLTKHIYT